MPHFIPQSRTQHWDKQSIFMREEKVERVLLMTMLEYIHSEVCQQNLGQNIGPLRKEKFAKVDNLQIFQSLKEGTGFYVSCPIISVFHLIKFYWVFPVNQISSQVLWGSGTKRDKALFFQSGVTDIMFGLKKSRKASWRRYHFVFILRNKSH